MCHEQPPLPAKDSRIARVFLEYGPEYLRRHHVTREQRLAVQNISRCRTDEMGGHVRMCPHCGHSQIHFNSCRDRHCPACQWIDRATWVVKQDQRKLPVPLFLVTFTVPPEVGRIAFHNQELVLALLFRAANQTLQELAQSDGLGKLGVTSMLHTWSRKMDWHVHLHNMVTGGGFDGENWNPSKPQFLFALKRIRALFRKYMLQGLHALYDAHQLELHGELESLADPVEFGALMKKLWAQQWIVDVQARQGKPDRAVEYLGTYTRSVAISDHRITSCVDGRVTFKTRQGKTLTLEADEFIRRFLLHVLPSGFHKVRHYGLYSNSSGQLREKARQAILASQSTPPPEPNPHKAVLEAATWEDKVAILTGVDPRICPRCKRPGMVTTAFEPRPKRTPSPQPEDTS